VDRRSLPAAGFSTNRSIRALQELRRVTSLFSLGSKGSFSLFCSDMESLLRDVFQECRDVAENVALQCGKVQFNKSLCRLIKHIYLRCTIILENHIFMESLRINPACETALVELRRAMLCGQMLVTDWSRNHWWMSVTTSSDSASVGMVVFLNLRDVLLCLKVLMAIR
jgi:hypothetical protein